jgi:hypothetical protein
MRRLLATTAILAALSAPAMANFVAAGGTALEQADFMLNLADEKVGATTSSGVADLLNIGINSFNNLGVATGEGFDTASGNATITPNNDVLNAVTFMPSPSNFFTSFTTRGQLFAAGNVFITVNDQLGNTFTFMEAKDQDWTGGIGVEAVAGSGEFIASVTVWTDGVLGFKEVKQQTFGLQTAAIAETPIPASLPFFLAGIAGLFGLAKMRKQGVAT